MGARPHMLTSSIRQTLAREGMTASIQTRIRSGLGINNPICIYEMCQKLGAKVQFVDISMEGMYRRSGRPLILLSSRRPVPRRAFTCAHELGHHVFKHGSTVDELYDERSKEDRDRPEEVQANSFAAFILMPTIGVRNAFAVRGITVKRASPAQIFAIACNFGVGYSTLVAHLAYGIGDLTAARAEELRTASPKSIRAQMLGFESQRPLVVADEHWNASTLDLEVGSNVLLPTKVTVSEGILEARGTYGANTLYEAVRPGIRQAIGPSPWATFIRVSRNEYIGLAAYRHLEDNDSEDEE